MDWISYRFSGERHWRLNNVVKTTYARERTEGDFDVVSYPASDLDATAGRIAGPFPTLEAAKAAYLILC